MFKSIPMKRKFNVKTYFVISLCLLLEFANAQTNLPSEIKKSEKTKDSLWFLGSIAGFKAIKSLVVYDAGILVSRSIAKGKRVHVEVGYRFSGPNLAQDWGAIPMNMKTDIGSLLLGAGYDWFPFVSDNSHGSFLKSVKVIGGVWYLNKSDYKFNASLQDPLVWGSITFSPTEVGNVATTITTNKVQPFLGLGYDDFYSSRAVNFSINGGFLYQGKPEVTMVATNMLKPTEESAPRFEQNLSSYQFSPFIQLLVQFNIK